METSGLGRHDVNFLALLSEPNRRRVLEGSKRAAYPAGTLAYRPGDPPCAFLIERGLVRGYWSVRDGRQATVGFLHKNELAGGTTIMNETPWAFIQVITESRLRTLDLEKVRNLVATEIEVLRAVAIHLATQARHGGMLVAVRSLGNIRERLAYDLLERACRSQLAAGRLQVRATHTDLAASIGSSREVVTRALKGFRADGIVKTAPGVIRVEDPMRLATIVRAFAL